MSDPTDFFLLAFPALLSIINPLGGAFIFLGATESLSDELRRDLARWVGIHSFLILNASLWIGAYVLGFFGISLPVLRVAGGIVIAMTAWKILYAEDEPSRHHPLNITSPRDASRAAFFPLTMPVTAGPGTIAVAVALGSNRPRGAGHLAVFALEATIVTVLLSAIVYGLYRYADRLSRVIGANGTNIILRLTGFLLFCIGIQVAWTGAAELLSSVLESGR
jgi:multiple antibiotic resistance protein